MSEPFRVAVGMVLQRSAKPDADADFTPLERFRVMEFGEHEGDSVIWCWVLNPQLTQDRSPWIYFHPHEITPEWFIPD